MDKELQDSQAQKQSNEMMQSSNTTIQSNKNKNNKRKLNYYSVAVAAAILLIILTFSIMRSEHESEKTSSSLTIEKGYSIDIESTVDITHMTKWYYFEKNKVSEYDLGTVQPFISKLYNSNVKSEELPEAPDEQLLLRMSNGQVAQVAVIKDDTNDQYYFADVNTKQALLITIEEAKDITYMIFDSAKRSLIIPVQTFLFILLLIMYVNTVLKISPKKKEKLEMKKRSYYFFVGIGTYFVFTFVNGLSLYYFDSYNGLFIASVMASLLLMKALFEYYNGRFDRSIFEIPVFFVFVLLSTFVICS